MSLTRAYVPYGTPDTHVTRQPLKYGGNGRESLAPVIIEPDTVTADARGIKTVWAGTVLVKITSGPSTGAYGPYASGATDGRQTLGQAPNVVVCSADVNLTVSPEDGVYKPVEIGGYYAYAEFNFSQLTTNGATISALGTAMPTCTFWPS